MPQRNPPAQVGKAMQEYTLVDTFTGLIGENVSAKQYELVCPRPDCKGTITVPLGRTSGWPPRPVALSRKDLLVSRFIARPCFHCFRTALLPEKVQD